MRGCLLGFLRFSRSSCGSSQAMCPRCCTSSPTNWRRGHMKMASLICCQIPPPHRSTNWFSLFVPCWIRRRRRRSCHSILLKIAGFQNSLTVFVSFARVLFFFLFLSGILVSMELEGFFSSLRVSGSVYCESGKWKHNGETWGWGNREESQGCEAIARPYSHHHQPQG